MKKLPKRNDAEKQLTGTFSQLQEQPASQEINNVHFNHPGKIKEDDVSLQNVSKIIKGFIQKATSFISEVSLRKFTAPVLTPRFNTSITTKFRLLAQYLKLPAFFASAAPLQRTLKEKQDDSRPINVVDEEIILKLQNALSFHQATGGTKVTNQKGEFLGKIKKLTYNNEKEIQYIILNCTEFFGRRNRYFAVPASSNLLELSEKGELILKLNKNDLRLAKGISAKKCPEPNLPFGPSIYELYNYKDSSDKKTGTE